MFCFILCSNIYYFDRRKSLVKQVRYTWLSNCDLMLMNCNKVVAVFATKNWDVRFGL